MNTFRYAFTALFLCIFTFSFAQTPNAGATKALNNYVHFTNESIHGLMIVHRLLENFNQEVNQYVDLQSNQLNFFANKDLPKNIFIDPEKWFYEIPPYDWYKVAKEESRFLKPNEARKLNAHLEKLKRIITRVNEVRFELETFIKTKDLQKEENQTEIFRQLEACVNLYENFYLEKEVLRKNLKQIHRKNYFKETPYRSLGVPVLKDLHNSILPILKSLRYEVTGTLPDLTKKVETNIRQLNEIVNIHARYKMAKLGAQDFLKNLKKYQSVASFDKKYKLYGKSYYFHNVKLTAATNRYSGGMIKATNDMILLESAHELLLLEEPHYFKVIYPKKEIQRSDEVQIIEEVPEQINDRNVIVRQQSIKVDKTEFTLQIYDHKEIDGDIISVNLNGKWIIEKQELKNRPFKFKIKINPKGENYILLHAENLGKTPPNTAAIIYYYKGKRKQVVLNSNLNESEMIRLEYSKD